MMNEREFTEMSPLVYDVSQTAGMKNDGGEIKTKEIKKTCIQIALYLAIVFSCTMLLFFLFSSTSTTLRNLDYSDIQKYTPGSVTTKVVRMPRILWIYTQNENDTEPYENDVFLHYYVQLGHKNSYEVRYVNSWSSYDWLSDQKIAIISKTMANSNINQGVHNMLKLALLHQHGGLLLNWGNFFIRQDFRWLQEMFDVYEGQPSLSLGCSPSASYVYMPVAISQSDKQPKLTNRMMAAVPNSTFIHDSFMVLSRAITQNMYATVTQFKDLKWESVPNIYYFDDSLESIVNSVLDQKYKKLGSNFNDMSCQIGLQFTKDAVYAEYQQQDFLEILISSNGLQTIQTISMKQNKSFNRKTVFLSDLRRQDSIHQYLGKLLDGQIGVPASIQSCFMYRLLSVSENKRVFIDPLPERNIQFCLVVMDPLTSEEIIQTSSAFDNQSYQNWKLVLPAKDVQIENIPKIGNQRVTVMAAYSTQVHLIQKALAKHCPQKGYAVLLHKGQNFNVRDALEKIAQTVKPYQIAGLFVSLQFDGHLSIPTNRSLMYNKYQNGIIKPRFKKADKVLNFFRVFAIQTFLQIPQFYLRDIYGKYYQDRLVFLVDILTFYQKTEEQTIDLRHRFVMKKYAHLWNMGTMVTIMPKTVSIKAVAWEEVNRQQIYTTRTRLDSCNFRYQIQNLLIERIPYRKLVVYNTAPDFVSVDERQGPDLIPRIIHQVWLGKTIPPAKQYLIDKTTRMYPHYEMKVWREHNITQQLFPTTYEWIKHLIEFDKHSRMNKLATVTDIMRHEILYREGGFWKDAGMNLLRPIFDKFRKYKLVLPTDRLFKYRWLQGMCFFANVPHYENMQRINNYRNLNRMKIISATALSIAGPVDFRQLLVGQEQIDSEILLMPYETFYPGQVIQHPEDDLCTRRRHQRKRGQKYQIKQNGWYLLSNCAELYPYAFGLQHNRFGGSWGILRST